MSPVPAPLGMNFRTVHGGKSLCYNCRAWCAITAVDANEEMFTKLMDDESFARDVKEYLLRRVYRRLNTPVQPPPPTAVGTQE